MSTDNRDTSALPVDAMAREITQWVIDQYGVEAQHLWERWPEYAVFRHQTRTSNKGPWFLLVANVDYTQIDKTDHSGEVFIAVVKADPNLIDELACLPGYARGYHMNKQHWLTILLDGSVPLSAVQQHIEDSFCLTKPANA